jgi:N-acetylglucosaminyldiphosphoundecaprenol N-acetyl-beta-D-mannosaminyltransferase
MKNQLILNSKVSLGSYGEFIEEISSLASRKVPSYVCFANVHMIVEAYRNPAFSRIVNEANIVAPDGMPLSIFLRLTENTRQDRVCGMDILPDLLKRAEEKGNSVFFLGGTDEVLNLVTKKTRQEYPLLKIAGHYVPPFRTLSEAENNMIANRINQTSANMVFVALGCPKQERWMAKNKAKINACLLGFGQAFKVYAGQEKRLPKWMRKLCLEWVYRFYLEPSRLWKRYLYTNPYFLWLCVGELIRSFVSQVSNDFQKAKVFHPRH